LSTSMEAMLRNAELFRPLLVDDITYLSGYVRRRKLNPGESLFRAGEQAAQFYIVESGEVSVFKSSAGDTIELARYVANEVVGDFDFAIGAVRDASASSTAGASVLEFPASGYGLAKLAEEKPDTIARIYLQSLAMVSSRLRATQKLISENAPWIRELKRQVYTDPSTGLYTFTFVEEELPKIIGEDAALFLIKPDRFKELNDALGHAAGDAAMGGIALMLKAQVAGLGRGWAIRMRSNETALVVPHASAAEAKAIARDLALAMRRVELPPIPEKPGFFLSASLAFGLFPEDGAELRALMGKLSELALDIWKNGGDRIVHGVKDIGGERG
jgi:diguanylate cyclase (GGDEF)-like protein